MDLLVKSFAPDGELVNGKNTINNLNASFKPHGKSLTAKERKNIRTVGNSRYGLVKIVEKMSLQHDSKLAKEDNAVDLSVRVAHLDKVRQYKIAVQSMFEMLDDTDKALGRDIMALVDKFSSALQTARQHDGDVDEAMKELDDYNARFGAAMKEEEENGEQPADNQAPESPTQA